MTTNGTKVRLHHFTDPACPWAFSAERQRLRLRWLYGDQLEWDTRMVVLSEVPNPDFTPELLAGWRRTLQERFGMPIAWSPPPEVTASVDACRAVVAARDHAEDRGEALLRRLRVLTFVGLALDDPRVIDRAATEAGLDTARLRGWMAEPEAEAALREDMRAARSPSPAARAQDHKLAGPPEERRYTCPSYELERVAPAVQDTPSAQRVDLPGFQPIESYEAAIANLAPELERRPDPEDAREVLAWAPFPLATAEVAAICARPLPDVREELVHVGRFEAAGADGYWSPA